MPIRNSVTINEVIELLNDAIKTDQWAITNLVNSRVACNADLSRHSTIQVDTTKGFYVGILGILNGIFGIAEDGYGALAANYELICPQGHLIEKEQNIKDKCKVCNCPIELGKIIGFSKIRE